MKDWLRAFPAIAELDADCRRLIIDTAQPMQVPKGAVLFRDGDDCGAYVMVVSGSVRVQKMDAEGREIVLYRVEEGQTCVLTTTCLIGASRYPAEGVAETDVSLVLVPRAVFAEAIDRCAGFRRFAIAAIGRRIHDLMLLIEDVAFARMDKRLARLLLAKLNQGEESIAATHQELAVELGTAREVISRLLKDFERRGWLKLARGRVDVVEAGELAQLGRD